MSKYIIDIPKTVGTLEKVGSVHYTYFDGIQRQTIVLKGDEIEELNSDYINEHFGDLQDTAYQRGLEDGKAVHDKGCEGCRYECENKRRVPCILCSDNIKLPSTISPSKLKSQWAAKGDEGCKYAGSPQGSSPCFNCSNYYQNNWTAKDDKIEVGDEVKWNDDLVVITRFCDDPQWLDGIDKDGKAYHIFESNARKTGRHFDIEKILEDMHHD